MGDFSKYQFAFFPKERLEWGSKYYVNFSYTYEGAEYDENWCFSTRSLKNLVDKVYKVEKNGNDVSFDVVNNLNYALYLVPRSGDDLIRSYSYRNSPSAELSIELIDQNTMSIRLKGSIGGTAEIKFSNGQQVSFKLAESDKASLPKDEVCGEDVEDNESEVDVNETNETSDNNGTGDTGDTNETNETSDNNETGDTGDTNETNGTSDNNGTGDTGDTNETNGTSDNNGTGNTNETNGTSDNNGTGNTNETNGTSDNNGTSNTNETNGTSDNNGTGDTGDTNETNGTNDNNETGDNGDVR